MGNVPSIERVVTDPVGYRYRLAIRNGQITVARDDQETSEVIAADRTQIQIIRAYLDRMSKIGGKTYPSEQCGNITLSVREGPVRIIVQQNGQEIEIHPPSWMPIACEIDLLLPRLEGGEPQINLRDGQGKGTLH